MLRIVECASPNFDDRATGRAVDMLVLHYTGMKTGEAALERLCDPATKVSAHYCIDEDGTCVRLVNEAQRAWHAGISAWAGERDINSCSIGIELVNPGHEFGYRPFPAAQMTSLIHLCRDILGRYPVPPQRILGHSDVAPLRKQDPGELFDWPALAAAGFGLWPGDPAPVPVPSVAELQAMLRHYGYAAPQSGVLDEDTQAVVAAFQRHFRPSQVSGQADGETVARLQALIRLVDGAGAPS